MPGLNDVGVVVAGRFHICARRNGGQVRCWGRGDDGQVGNGTNTTANTSPTTILAA